MSQALAMLRRGAVVHAPVSLRRVLPFRCASAPLRSHADKPAPSMPASAPTTASLTRGWRPALHCCKNSRRQASKAKLSAAKIGAFLPDIASPSKSPVTLYARKCSSFPLSRPVGTRSVSGNSEPMQIARTQSAAAALTHPDWRAALITFQMTIAARSLHVVRTVSKGQKESPYSLMY